MGTEFIIENGLLKRKLFVGPMPLADVKVNRFHDIAKVLDEYENVSENIAVNQGLKAQQIATTTAIKPISKEADHKVIRRRRKFVYSQADQVISKGYWIREERSLTKLHSNSLMYEYRLVQSGNRKPNPVTASGFKPRVIRIPKQ